MNRTFANSTRIATQRRNFIFYSVKKLKEREQQSKGTIITAASKL